MKGIIYVSLLNIAGTETTFYGFDGAYMVCSMVSKVPYMVLFMVRKFDRTWLPGYDINL